ncbi:ThuA domain-containing protein [Leadbettera azotonutricia]|uniref:Trehalose utilization protein n=1 Tax=Leadbettera azotonutricia (strain ATCC BAA-888 / DSM 13862 / ZAS-9) TaxID=545695 RepID=F5YBX0_LEAAZ|nr:ThuA domain-containing protein [Leadbettera azotonutricia]AEF81015.1 trehalose utilization protein [Leadbettera azotonutricia ZAS-9]
MINVTIYNEFVHETTHESVRAIYPQGIHGTIKAFLEKDSAIGKIRCATLADHREALSQEVLDDTDVLVWWGHMAHDKVDDAVVAKVIRRVLDGMGFIVLHSGHASKPFQRLLGTDTPLLRWREAGEKVRLWNIAKNHPITQGLGESWVIPHDETYGEPFGIPNPDELIFISWFQGGEVFRSGATWRRGEGKIFYFQNGHETFPIYHQKEVQLVITNAVKWANPCQRHCAVDRGKGNDAPFEKYELEDGSFTPVTRH